MGGCLPLEVHGPAESGDPIPDLRLLFTSEHGQVALWFSPLDL